MKSNERKVLLVVPEGGALFEPAGVADILNQANSLAPLGAPHYRLTVATPQESRVIRGRSGLHLLADACIKDIEPGQVWDTLIITNRIPDADTAKTVSLWLAQVSRSCRRIVSVCAGALVLADAGILAGRNATTHWRHLDALAAISPTTKVDRDSIFVRDGKIWTSAGASSGFDLTLALVEEDLGTEVARAVARDMVLYLRRPGGQAQFSRFLASQAAPDTTIGKVQVWALENIEKDLSIESLADRAAMSVRNFCRVFAKQTGTTPARFIEDIRLEAARSRLEQGHDTLDEVAVACGLGTALNLRRLFEKCLGVTPSDYRLRFGMK
jgi:transcriptional regulator GlxA family with amidase domain